MTFDPTLRQEAIQVQKATHARKCVDFAPLLQNTFATALNLANEYQSREYGIGLPNEISDADINTFPFDPAQLALFHELLQQILVVAQTPSSEGAPLTYTAVNNLIKE